MPSGRSRSEDVLLLPFSLQRMIKPHLRRFPHVRRDMWHEATRVHNSESLLCCAEPARLAGFYVYRVTQTECAFGECAPC